MTRTVILPGGIVAEVWWDGVITHHGERGGLLPPRTQRPSLMADGAPGSVQMPTPEQEKARTNARRAARRAARKRRCTGLSVRVPRTQAPTPGEDAE